MRAIFFCPECEDETEHWVSPAEPQTYHDPGVPESAECEECACQNWTVDVREVLEGVR